MRLKPYWNTKPPSAQHSVFYIQEYIEKPGRQCAFEQVLPGLQGMQSAEDGFTRRASLKIMARRPLDLPPQEWYERLAALAGGAQVQALGTAIPAYQCQKNTPLVRAFLAAIRAAGGTPGFVYKTGTADLNIVAP